MLIKTYIKITETLRIFKKDERGVTAIEYGLIALAMAGFVVVSYTGEGNFLDVLKTKFVGLSEAIDVFASIG